MLQNSISRKRKIHEIMPSSQLDKINSMKKRKYNKDIIYQFAKKIVKEQEDNSESENENEDGKVNEKLSALEKLFGDGVEHKGGLFGGSDDSTVYMRDNHIYFKDHVDEGSINKLTKLINEYNDKVKQQKKTMPLFEEDKLEPKPLYLHISSYGGALDEGLLAHDYIKNSQVPIHTVVEGYAMSCGSIMSVAGKKRYMTKNSVIMIHQLRSSGSEGKFKDIEDDYLNSKDYMERIVNIYYEHCNKKMTKKEIRDALDNDRYWSFEEAHKRGLVDEVYTYK